MAVPKSSSEEDEELLFSRFDFSEMRFFFWKLRRNLCFELRNSEVIISSCLSFVIMLTQSSSFFFSFLVNFKLSLRICFQVLFSLAAITEQTEE